MITVTDHSGQDFVIVDGDSYIVTEHCFLEVKDKNYKALALFHSWQRVTVDQVESGASN